MINTTTLPQRAEGIKTSDNDLFVSLDVVSLYTSIPHGLGLEALQVFCLPKLGQTLLKAIVSIMRIIFEQNVFTF